VKVKKIEKYQRPSIISLRKNKICLEQAACWQCDMVITLPSK